MLVGSIADLRSPAPPRVSALLCRLQEFWEYRDRSQRGQGRVLGRGVAGLWLDHLRSNLDGWPPVGTTSRDGSYGRAAATPVVSAVSRWAAVAPDHRVLTRLHSVVVGLVWTRRVRRRHCTSSSIVVGRAKPALS